MSRGKIKNGKLAYRTRKVNHMSPRGNASTGGEEVIVDIENINGFDLEDGDRVTFKLNENEKAIITKINEKVRLKISLGEIVQMINSKTYVELQLNKDIVKSYDNFVFNYEIIFTDQSNKYNKYFAEISLKTPIVLGSYNWDNYYNINKNNKNILTCEKAVSKTTSIYVKSKYDKVFDNLDFM